MRQGIERYIAISSVLLAALFLLPAAVTEPSSLFTDKAPEEEEIPLEETIISQEREPFTGGEADSDITLRVLHDGEIEEMDLGTYLTGVVRAEMPASFAQEALNAQAVAARTYTLNKLRGSKHGESADICTDHTCCQAYQTLETAWRNWGSDAPKWEGKIETAVKSTDGQVILYENRPIEAVFHSSSAGLTRSAGTVWTNDEPYLVPVTSPEENPEEKASIPNYYSRVELTPEEFREKIKKEYPSANLTGAPEGWLQNAETDEAGSVIHIDVGGITMRGSTLRGLLGLRSACFDCETENQKLVFYVSGYGHGVGMSQYGANAMAQSGANYREILTHYYTGVTIASLQDIRLSC